MVNSISNCLRRKGFSMMEIVLVVVIIGVMLLIIVPRAARVREDAKFNSVRQEAAELAKWGNIWAERAVETQDSTVYCTKINFVNTLWTASETTGYTADGTNTNWTAPSGSQPSQVATCSSSTNFRPRNTVQEIMPTEQTLRNPFTGINYFEAQNNGNVAGAIMLYGAASTKDPGYWEYYLIFRGKTGSWFGSMNTDLGDGLRNGVFFARLR